MQMLQPNKSVDPMAPDPVPQNEVPAAMPTMLTVDDIARMLVCSPRTVYRLTDAKCLPPPVRLGALARWPRAVIDAWVAEGCPAGRPGRPGRR